MTVWYPLWKLLNVNVHLPSFVFCIYGLLSISRFTYSFIGCENYPKCNYTKKLDESEKSKVQSSNDDNNDSTSVKPAHTSVELGDGISFKTGRYGPYVTDGTKNVPAKNRAVRAAS